MTDTIRNYINAPAARCHLDFMEYPNPLLVAFVLIYAMSVLPLIDGQTVVHWALSGWEVCKITLMTSAVISALVVWAIVMTFWAITRKRRIASLEFSLGFALSDATHHWHVANDHVKAYLAISGLRWRSEHYARGLETSLDEIHSQLQASQAEVQDLKAKLESQQPPVASRTRSRNLLRSV
jgi:hypothetical protein